MLLLYETLTVHFEGLREDYFSCCILLRFPTLPIEKPFMSSLVFRRHEFQRVDKKPATVCCVYLGHSLLAVQGVFGARLAGGAPVEVELSGDVAVRQAGQVHLGGQRQLNWRPGEMRRRRTKRDTGGMISLVTRRKSVWLRCCQRRALQTLPGYL